MKKRITRHLALILSILCIIGTFSGCGGSGSAASSGSAAASGSVIEETGPVYGGKLVVSNINEPHCLDPRKDLGTYGGIVGMQIYERLIGSDPETGEAVPGLATSWEHSDDGLTYTFKLREGVKWHDGEDFNADDVVYTFSYYTGEREGAEYASLFNLLESCTKVDDYTVEFKFSAPWDSFELLLKNHFCTFIVPEHACESIGWDDYGLNADTVIGTGPFKLKYYVMGEPVQVVKNENYWQEGLPYLDEIEFRYIADATSRTINATTGEVHVTNEPATDQIESMLQYDFLSLQNQPGNGVISVQFNSDVDRLMGDVRIRQAIAYGIDREVMCEAIYGDNAIVAYDDFPAWHESYDPDYKNYEYNPELAKQLLAEAGYDENNPFKWKHMTTTNSMLVDMLTIMQAQLAEINIEMEILPMESGVRNAIIKGKDGYSRDDYHAITTLQALPGGSTDDYMWKYFSPGGSTNKFNYNMEGGTQNPKVVELLTEARTSLDVEKRTALYREAIPMIDADCVRIPLVYINNMAIVNDCVHDFYLLNTPIVSYAQVWMDN